MRSPKLKPYCIKCLKFISKRTKALQCDDCDLWQHLYCIGSITHNQYHLACIGLLNIEWSCAYCLRSDHLGRIQSNDKSRSRIIPTINFNKTSEKSAATVKDTPKPIKPKEIKKETRRNSVAPQLTMIPECIDEKPSVELSTPIPKSVNLRKISESLMKSVASIDLSSIRDLNAGKPVYSPQSMALIYGTPLRSSPILTPNQRDVESPYFKGNEAKVEISPISSFSKKSSHRFNNLSRSQSVKCDNKKKKAARSNMGKYVNRYSRRDSSSDRGDHDVPIEYRALSTDESDQGTAAATTITHFTTIPKKCGSKDKPIANRKRLTRKRSRVRRANSFIEKTDDPMKIIIRRSQLVQDLTSSSSGSEYEGEPTTLIDKLPVERQPSIRMRTKLIGLSSDSANEDSSKSVEEANRTFNITNEIKRDSALNLCKVADIAISTPSRNVSIVDDVFWDTERKDEGICCTKDEEKSMDDETTAIDTVLTPLSNLSFDMNIKTPEYDTIKSNIKMTSPHKRASMIIEQQDAKTLEMIRLLLETSSIGK